MMRFYQVLFLATLISQIVSCSEDVVGSSEGGSEDSVGVETPEVGGSSDPIEQISYTLDTGVFVDPRDGNEYSWVEIDSVRWMRQNLNFKSDWGSVCYENEEENCETYGRLYSWQGAMFQKDGSMIRDVCPEGWQVPANYYWVKLKSAISGRFPDASHTLFLLPAGTGKTIFGDGFGENENVYFKELGETTSWWTPDITPYSNPEFPIRYSLSNTEILEKEEGDWAFNDEVINSEQEWLPVRCVQPRGGIVSKPDKITYTNTDTSTNDMDEVSELVPDSVNALTGTFIDLRDSTQYMWTKIGGVIWMNENLAYEKRGSYLHFDTWGYTWAEAMNLKYEYNFKIAEAEQELGQGVRGLCPAGWHLPTIEEWGELLNVVDSADGTISYTENEWPQIAQTLGFQQEYMESQDDGTLKTKTQTYGFLTRKYTGYWTSKQGGSGYAWRYRRENEDIDRGFHRKDLRYAVRCVANIEE